MRGSEGKGVVVHQNDELDPIMIHVPFRTAEMHKLFTV